MQFSCFQIQKQYKNRTGNAAQHQIAVQGITSGHHKIWAETQKKSSSEGDFFIIKDKGHAPGAGDPQKNTGKGSRKSYQKNGQIPFPEKLDQQYDKVSIERALTTVKILRIERQHIEITIGTVIGQTPGVISKSGFVYM